RLSADDPSTQPLVTGVGGTTLLAHGNTNGSEQVWNLASASGAGASGGGISRYWTAPTWQDAPGVRNSYSTGEPCQAPNGQICREAPDVALHADPHHGYLAFCTVKAAGWKDQ